MTSFFLGIGGGIFAWFATMLIGQPIVAFCALRRQVVKSLVHYNASGIDNRATSGKWLEERSIVLHNQGAELIAFAVTELFVPKILRGLGLDPLGAGIALSHLANLSPGVPECQKSYDETIKALRVKHWVL